MIRVRRLLLDSSY